MSTSLCAAALVLALFTTTCVATAPRLPTGPVVIRPVSADTVKPPDSWTVKFSDTRPIDALQTIANTTRRPVRAVGDLDMPALTLHFPAADSGRDTAPLAETLAAIGAELQRSGWTLEDGPVIVVRRVAQAPGEDAEVLDLKPDDPGERAVDRMSVSYDGTSISDVLQTVANATRRPVRAAELPALRFTFRVPAEGSAEDQLSIPELVDAIRSELERSGWTFDVTDDAVLVHRVGSR